MVEKASERDASANGGSEVGHNTLPKPAHTTKDRRRIVSFGANMCFEAGATPPKVKQTVRTHAKRTGTGARTHSHGTAYLIAVLVAVGPSVIRPHTAVLR